MKLTTATPAQKLAGAKGDLIACRGLIVTLAAQRKAALAEAADVAEVRAIDKRLAEQESLARTLVDRIAAQKIEVRKAEFARREKVRAAVIKSLIEPACDELQALTVDVEKSLVAFSENFAKLKAKHAELFRNWPADVPRDRFSKSFGLGDIERRVLRAFRWVSEGAPDGLARVGDLAAGGDQSISAGMRRLTKSFIELTRAAPIVLPPDGDDDDDLGVAA